MATGEGQPTIREEQMAKAIATRERGTSREQPMWVLQAVQKELARETQKDPFLQREMVTFEKAMRKYAAVGVPERKIAHEIRSSSARQAVVRLVVEQVRLNADIDRVRFRERSLRTLRMEVDRVVDLHEPAPEERGRLDPFFVCYTRKQAAIEAQEAVLWIADQPEDTLHGIVDAESEADFPEFLRERTGEFGPSEFYRDLAGVFCDGDEDERSHARSILKDRELALETAKDEDASEVFRQLGHVVYCSGKEVERAC